MDESDEDQIIGSIIIVPSLSLVLTGSRRGGTPSTPKRSSSLSWAKSSSALATRSSRLKLLRLDLRENIFQRVNKISFNLDSCLRSKNLGLILQELTLNYISFLMEVGVLFKLLQHLSLVSFLSMLTVSPPVNYSKSL